MISRSFRSHAGSYLVFPSYDGEAQVPVACRRCHWRRGIVCLFPRCVVYDDEAFKDRNASEDAEDASAR